MAAVGDGEDFAVADVPHDAAEVAHPGDAQRDVLDHTNHPGKFHGVAHPVLVFQHDENAGQIVLHKVLRAETERHAEDAGAGEQRGDVDAEQRQNGEQGNAAGDHRHHAAQQRADRVRPLGTSLGERIHTQAVCRGGRRGGGLRGRAGLVSCFGIDHVRRHRRRECRPTFG